MTRTRRRGALAGLMTLAYLTVLPQARAQIDPLNERRWVVASGDYAVPANWDPSSMAPPEARFGEGAVIANGGTANVLGTVPSAVDGLEATPGQLSVSSGVLNLAAAGRLRVVPGTLGAIGAASVTGTGVLQIANGGILESESLQLGGTFRPQITSSGFMPIDVANAASLGGNLNVTFSDFTPSPTDTWKLIEAGSLGGGFASITATGANLLPGQFLNTRTVDAGGGRVAAELFFDHRLALEVNRLDGSVSLASPSGLAVQIDGYRIRSASGSLDATNAVWSSLQEQVGNGWRESNASANQVAELKQTGSTSIGGTKITLGDIYSPTAPPAFRVSAPGAEDLVFDYTSPDGTERQGMVSYVGAFVNDLLLTVDPTDGRVQLSNPSGFDVAIEGYSIRSASGSLAPAGWTSLDDADGPGNNDGGWRESNPSDGFMGELLQSGQQMVADGAQFQLGAIYDFASEAKDLVFEFLLAGEPDGFVGTVLYLELPGAGDRPGDYNGDNVVDSADYVTWRNNPASHGGNPAGYNTWRTNFGRVFPGGVAATSPSGVPEPSAYVIFAVGLGAIACLYRRS
jgi:hypothetical protein